MFKKPHLLMDDSNLPLYVFFFFSITLLCSRVWGGGQGVAAGMSNDYALLKSPECTSDECPHVKWQGLKISCECCLFLLSNFFFFFWFPNRKCKKSHRLEVMHLRGIKKIYIVAKKKKHTCSKNE